MTPTPPAPIAGLHPLVWSYDPCRSKTRVCDRSEWGTVREHVIRLVAAAPEASGPGVRRYLSVSTRLAVHAYRNGWGLTPEILLSPQVVEHFIHTLAGSQATFRSQLRRLAAAHGLPSPEGGQTYARRPLRAPYEPAELEALWRFASALSNAHRRVSLQALLVLGVGFGLSRGDLRGVAASSLHQHSRRLHLTVPSDGRCVPAASGWAARARQVAAARPSGPLIGRSSGVNLTDRHVEWVGDRAGVPRLSPDRLRASWLVALIASGTPLTDLVVWSGVRSAAALDPYLRHVAPQPSCPRADA